MNSIEEIRQVIFTSFKAFHDASFPTVPISWPNYLTVDTEALTGSFVSVQLTFRGGGSIYDITAINDIVKGELLISYLRPANTGLTGSAAYSDALRSNLCNHRISGITFFGLSILEVSPAPGIVGQMNVIPFMI